MERTTARSVIDRLDRHREAHTSGAVLLARGWHVQMFESWR
ncbi:MAG: hypothetical protein R2722_11370 [Tessaracoccus sp.]